MSTCLDGTASVKCVTKESVNLDCTFSPSLVSGRRSCLVLTDRFVPCRPPRRPPSFFPPTFLPLVRAGAVPAARRSLARSAVKSTCVGLTASSLVHRLVVELADQFARTSCGRRCVFLCRPRPRTCSESSRLCPPELCDLVLPRPVILAPLLAVL